MILTLQISDEDLSDLKDALRVTKEDFQLMQSDYAKRILRARIALKLSNTADQAIIGGHPAKNFSMPPG